MSFVKNLYTSIIYSRIGIDDRSLALFRILVGVLIIIDVLLRFRNLNFFYTDLGPVKSELIISDFNQFSLLYYITDPIGVSIVFIVQILLAIILILGYKTKTVFIISTILVISVDLRNPYVASYADTLFRLLLFWAIFLPLGNKWSIDSIRENKSCTKHSILNQIAGFFILIQMLAMYFVNGSIKYTNYEEWLSGWAFHSILHYDRITWFLGPYVRESPEWIIQFGSIYWFSMMLIAPVMILFTKRIRYILAGALMFGHLNIAVTTRVGAFSFVAIAGLCLFLPKQFWTDLNTFVKYIPVNINIDTRKLVNRIDSSIPHVKILPHDKDVAKTITVISIIFVLIAGSSMILVTGYNSDYTDNSEDIDSVELVNVETDFINKYFSVIRVGQPEWGFYTSGRNTDTFYVFAAETESGDTVDIFNDLDTVKFERPYEHNLQEQFQTYRYRFYYSSVGRSSDPDSSAASYLADYHCKNPNTNEPITQITMYEITEQWAEDNMGDLDDYDIRSINVIHAHSCNNSIPELIEEPENLNQNSIPSNIEKN